MAENIIQPDYQKASADHFLRMKINSFLSTKMINNMQLQLKKRILNERKRNAASKKHQSGLEIV